MPDTILLTGCSGQVGGELLRTLAPLGQVIAPTRGELDLSRPETVRGVVRSVKPRWIVNPAAYTAVDKAESEPELAFAVNATSVAVLGEEARRSGATVLHFSTDYVFSGEGTTAYRETDPTGPAGVYGASKLAGERALASSGAAHLIFRTSWVYGATVKNFLLTILQLARERESLRIVADQYGAPTGSRDLAEMTAAVLKRLQGNQVSSQGEAEPLTAYNGLYHACGQGETTWFGFAQQALRQVRQREPESSLATLVPIPTADYPTPAKRPANSRMDCSKLAQTFGSTMPHWTATLSRVLDELASSQR